MKQLVTYKLLRRIFVLSCLVVVLFFVASSDNTQVVQAFPCCSECPGFSQVDLYDACEAQCGSASGSCYDNCVYYGERCWRMCRVCLGGGGGNSCVSNDQCQIWNGEYCINGICQDSYGGCSYQGQSCNFQGQIGTCQASGSGYLCQL